MNPEDDDEIWLPKQSRSEIEPALALLEGLDTDHIDIEKEEAEINRRQKARELLAFDVLDNLKGKHTEESIRQLFKQAGVFDGMEKDTQLGLMLRLIRLGRQRRN